MFHNFASRLQIGEKCLFYSSLYRYDTTTLEKQIQERQFLYLKMNLLSQKLAGIYNAPIPYKTTEILSFIDALNNQ